MNKRQLVKAVRDVAVYQDIYINSIYLTNGAINALRTLIQEGILEPDIDMVREIYKNVNAVMCGDVILPHMAYTKRKEILK